MRSFIVASQSVSALDNQPRPYLTIPQPLMDDELYLPLKNTNPICRMWRISDRVITPVIHRRICGKDINNPHLVKISHSILPKPLKDKSF